MTGTCGSTGLSHQLDYALGRRRLCDSTGVLRLTLQGCQGIVGYAVLLLGRRWGRCRRDVLSISGTIDFNVLAMRLVEDTG